MKKIFILGVLIAISTMGYSRQQNTASTDLPGKGPCTNFPERYDKVEERLAWFYGCMHENPPTVAEIKRQLATLPPEKRKLLETYDFANQEATYGVAFYKLPIQVFPDKKRN